MDARKAGLGGIYRGSFPKSRISASAGRALAFPGKHGLACRKEGAGRWPGAHSAMHDKGNYRASHEAYWRAYFGVFPDGEPSVCTGGLATVT